MIKLGILILIKALAERELDHPTNTRGPTYTTFYGIRSNQTSIRMARKTLKASARYRFGCLTDVIVAVKFEAFGLWFRASARIVMAMTAHMMLGLPVCRFWAWVSRYRYRFQV